MGKFAGGVACSRLNTSESATLAEDKSSYALSFGKGLAPGSKWVGKDPALRARIFRLRMERGTMQQLRLCATTISPCTSDNLSRYDD